MVKSMKLSNFLSFGSDSEEIELLPLNVIIGANGSGKSNFLEAFDLLRSAPSDITNPIRIGGGVSDWIFKKREGGSRTKLDFVLRNTLPESKYDLRYVFSFDDVSRKFELVDEKIESEKPLKGETNPYIIYDYSNGKPVINMAGGEKRKLTREDIDTEQSILSQKRDSFHYPEITYLANRFSKIRMYREWSFGRFTPCRLPQKVDLRNDFLEADGSNLGLVLNHMRNHLPTKDKILCELKAFYGDVVDYEVTLESSQAQIFFQEQGFDSSIPATRLSDGTLRYLCLLAILCNPNPPPLICLEEPELGMHPDIIPEIARLLKETSRKCQLVVTTHSEILVDALTDMPETIIVAEKMDGGTKLERLKADKLKLWLEEFRLGKLWSRGDIGGNRW